MDSGERRNDGKAINQRFLKQRVATLRRLMLGEWS